MLTRQRRKVLRPDGAASTAARCGRPAGRSRGAARRSPRRRREILAAKHRLALPGPCAFAARRSSPDPPGAPRRAAPPLRLRSCALQAGTNGFRRQRRLIRLRRAARASAPASMHGRVHADARRASRS